MPVLPVKPRLPMLPTASTAFEGDVVDVAGAGAAAVLATKVGEAVELTWTVARSRVSCCSLGMATGSCGGQLEAAAVEANLLAALSSVLRLMVIFTPSSVRLAEGPFTLSVALVTDDRDAELVEQRC